jgi:diphosphomevalonate decarboxylase
LLISEKKKKVSSRSGMQDASSSPHYDDWLEQSANDLDQIQSAIAVGDFNTLGSIAERDALSMHRVMQTQKPPLNYFLPETERIIESVKDFRENGVEVYCTIDAGPNVKLLYQQKDEPAIRDRFDGIVSIRPFN